MLALPRHIGRVEPHQKWARERTFGRLALLCAGALWVGACASMGTVPNRDAAIGFRAEQLAKTDIDRVVEVHQREIFINLRLVAEYLYRRNPREIEKSGAGNTAAAVARIFDADHAWRFAELDNRRDGEALGLALRPDFGGDRVLAVVVGIGGTIQKAFNDKTAFFVLDDVDPQRLDNCARQIDRMLPRLASAHDVQGYPLLRWESGYGWQGQDVGRELGKIVGQLEVLARVIEDKQSRSVERVVQGLFPALLPIK